MPASSRRSSLARSSRCCSSTLPSAIRYLARPASISRLLRAAASGSSALVGPPSTAGASASLLVGGACHDIRQELSSVVWSTGSVAAESWSPSQVRFAVSLRLVRPKLRIRAAEAVSSAQSNQSVPVRVAIAGSASGRSAASALGPNAPRSTLAHHITCTSSQVATPARSSGAISSTSSSTSSGPWPSAACAVNRKRRVLSSSRAVAWAASSASTVPSGRNACTAGTNQ